MRSHATQALTLGLFLLSTTAHAESDPFGDGSFPVHEGTPPDVAHYDHRLYVDSSARAGGDGSSWTNAFRRLQRALSETDSLSGTVEIWVASGTYFPRTATDSSDDRTKTFELRDDVAIYGGFAGGETDRNDRDPSTNVTRLSGNIGSVSDDSDNAYHVVTGVDVGSSAVLDGFLIIYGRADGADEDGGGGGIYLWYTSATIRNCKIIANRAQFGAGLRCLGDAPTIQDCLFMHNTADSTGGGMYASASDPYIKDCTFRHNEAGYGGGGGLALVTSGTSQDGNAIVLCCSFIDNHSASEGGGALNDSSEMTFANCVFLENHVDLFSTERPLETGYGAGAHNVDSSTTFVNCTFYGQYALTGPDGDVETSAAGGAVFDSGGGSEIINCIIWNNGSYPLDWDGHWPDVNYSCVSPDRVYDSWDDDGTFEDLDDFLDDYGVGNTTSDPLLDDPENEDVTLPWFSPCVDTGDNGAVPTSVSTDFDGDDRIQNGRVDMGAQEHSD